MRTWIVDRLGRALVALALVACSSSSSPNEGARDAATTTDGSSAGDLDASVQDAASPADASTADARVDDAASTEDASTAELEALPSAGCGDAALSAYPVGTTVAAIEHDGAERRFRVHVPPGYTGAEPRPLVLLLHGGGGSGRQFQEASSRFDAVADRENVLAVYPDGTGAIRTWNGGGCCGSAASGDVDDVGFVRELIDHLESGLCVDRRRIYATGMSNGAILSHRLGCELADRIAAIAPVAGTDLTSTCAPERPVPVLQIHGTDDGHVPFDGGVGCGLANVTFTSVPATLAAWRARNACSDQVDPERGGPFAAAPDEVRCESARDCARGADVTLCAVQAGGHNWPGGEPPAGLVSCPGNGGQSTWSASEAVWYFFAAHALR